MQKALKYYVKLHLYFVLTNIFYNKNVQKFSNH